VRTSEADLPRLEPSGVEVHTGAPFVPDQLMGTARRGVSTGTKWPLTCSAEVISLGPLGGMQAGRRQTVAHREASGPRSSEARAAGGEEMCDEGNRGKGRSK
jgi:hypothetical protein